MLERLEAYLTCARLSRAIQRISQHAKGYLLFERSVLILSIGLFLGGLGSEMIRPFVAPFFSYLGASPFIIGILFSLSSLFMMMTALPSGLISNKIGRKNTIILAISLQCVGTLTLALSETWPQALFGTSILYGSWGMMATVPPALVLDYVEPERGGLASGTLLFFSGISRIVAPLLGGIMATLSYSSAFSGALGFLIVGIVVITLFAAQSPKRGTETRKKSAVSKRTSISRILRTKNVTIILGIIFIVTIGEGISMNFIYLYAMDVIGASKVILGLMGSIAGLVGTFLPPVVGRESDRKGRKIFLALAYGLGATAYFLFGISQNYTHLIFSTIVWSLCEGIWMSPFRGFISDEIPPEDRAAALGFTYTLFGGVSIPSNTIGGVIWEKFSPRANFYVTSAIFMVGTILTLLLLEERRTNERCSKEHRFL